MNEIKYNFERHTELLKKDKNLRNQGKFLSKENEADYFELLQYGVVLEQHLL